MESELDDKILIHTSNLEVYKKLKFDMREPGIYQKWIDIKEVDKIWSEKRSIVGYSMPKGVVLRTTITEKMIEVEIMQIVTNAFEWIKK